VSAAIRRETEKAAKVLKSGGIVAFPTDTLYGLGADPFCDDAVRRVFEIKGRQETMGLPLLVSSMTQLQRVVSELPKTARDLIEHFWPGPLTLILSKSAAVSDLVTGGADSVAVRMPDHAVPLVLARELGGPVTGTSANPSGGPDPVTAADVRRLLGDSVDYVLDAGPTRAGIPSTILDLTEERPRVIRVGALPIESIRSVCALVSEEVV
jgi:L-threonylcarbamoyladenylate synthase